MKRKVRKVRALVTFSRPESVESYLVIATELTATYHGIKHHHSYNSQDCGNKLSNIMFSDSSIAKKIACGRTKASSIVENVLAPAGQELLIDDLKRAKYFSLGIDASNCDNLKMFPVTVQYFSEESGIKLGLLDFYEDSQETSEAIANQIRSVLEKNELDVNCLAGFSADNASVNFGKHVSVYEKLKKEVPTITRANCKCHILHNCTKFALKALSFDVEALVLKVYSEFTSSVKRTSELASFFEFVDLEYREILRHSPTRWLSLLPAIERLLINWPALKSYFFSQGEEECAKIIWNAFKDEEEDSLPLCFCYFLQNVMQVFQNNVKQMFYFSSPPLTET